MRKALILAIAITATIATATLAGWSEPVRISEPGGCLEPQIIAEGNTLHIIFAHWTVGRGVGYLRSSDAGITWSQELELSDVVNTEAPTFPKIIHYGSRLMAIWVAYFTHGVNRHNIGYALSENDGLTWSTPQYALNNNQRIGFFWAAAGTDSIINIIICGAPEDSVIFRDVKSTDFGQNWLTPIQIFTSAETGATDGVSLMVKYIFHGRDALTYQTNGKHTT